MRVLPFLALLIGAFPSWPAGAQETRSVSLKDLATRPRDFVGAAIRVPGIGCVDEPRRGFVCLALVEGRAVRIDATVLGGGTSASVAQKLIDGCKGTANLTRPECRFDAEIRPTSMVTEMVETAGGSLPVTVVIAPQIELRSPRR